MGFPIELVLEAGTHEVPDGINIDASMGASEVVLRAAPGAAVTLVANISVSVGVLVLDGRDGLGGRGLELRGSADSSAVAVSGGQIASESSA